MTRHYLKKRTGTQWTVEEDKQLEELIKERLSIKDIARRHKRTIGSILSRLAKNKHQYNLTINEQPVPPNSPKSPISDSEIKEIKEDMVLSVESAVIIECDEEWSPMISLPVPKGTLICIFDTETTGLPPSAPNTSEMYPRMVQCAYELYTTDGTLVEKACHILYPEDYTIPEETVKFHTITTDRAKQEGLLFDKWCEIWKDVLQRSQTLVAHNMIFDDNIVQSELYRHGKTDLLHTWKSMPKECTLMMGKRFFGKTDKLSIMYEKCGYSLANDQILHQADADAQLCSRIYFYLRANNVRNQRYNLRTEYEDKEVVKVLGARWDAGQRVWYIYEGDPFYSYVIKWFS
jgi:DNA polymerase III epsilon subunit-like protein